MDLIEHPVCGSLVARNAHSTNDIAVCKRRNNRGFRFETETPVFSLLFSQKESFFLPFLMSLPTGVTLPPNGLSEGYIRSILQRIESGLSVEESVRVYGGGMTHRRLSTKTTRPLTI